MTIVFLKDTEITVQWGISMWALTVPHTQRGSEVRALNPECSGFFPTDYFYLSKTNSLLPFIHTQLFQNYQCLAHKLVMTN